MAQKRIDDYASPINSADGNEVRKYLIPSGVFSGFTLGVDASFNLTIAAGAGLQPDGVFWEESTTTTLLFSAPGAPTDYTVVATHVNRNLTGGVAVEYAIQTGLLTTITDGVILGWIYHPGGVPLATTHLSGAPSMESSAYGSLLVDAAPQRLYAPLPRTFSDVATMGGNITFSGQTAATVLFDVANFVVYQRIAKAAGAPGAETLVQHVQFFMDAYRPTSFDLYTSITGSGLLTLELRDTDLNIVTLSSGNPITATAGWETKTVVVDRTSGTFDAGKPYELRLTSSVTVGDTVDLARLTMKSWPYPT